ACLYSKKKGLLSKLLKIDNTEIKEEDGGEFVKISIDERGALKQHLMNMGFPVTDLLGYEEGDKLSLSFVDDVILRPYQQEAVSSFIEPKSEAGN
ncbi:hypothetical protein, partial [Pseudomonas sp. 2995-3]|uniref:hypothetical protein n=1 Tax=Pseudomonas sp. 2995-3 TaxID=1712680 RepID=UPI001C457E17